MKLATIHNTDSTSAAVIVDATDGARAIALPATDVGTLLGDPNWRSVAEQADAAEGQPLDDVRLACPSLTPSKVVCVGLNYRSHILEMGRDLPTHPTLFAKFASNLIGPCDDVLLPPNSTEVDWEAELAIVIGSPVRSASREEAVAAIAGYTILNDVSMRDWQWRTTQWLQGKAFDASTPVGPYLVTADEVDPDQTGAPALDIRCDVNGETMQQANTGDLLFTPADAVAYVSQFTSLAPGDIIATGTPGGVGASRDPKRFLQQADVLTTEIEGLGRQVNGCIATSDDT